MRSLTFVLVLGATLVGSITSVRADDDLFLPSYRPYLKSATASPAAPPVAAAAERSTPSDPKSATAGRARLAWPKGGRASKTLVAPVAPPLNAPTAGPTVASALSVVADPPPYVAQSSRGVIGRLWKAEPVVPAGLPRGAEPVVMVPPEPLESRPALADAATDPEPRRPLDPIPTSRPASLSRTSTPRSSSPVAPFRPVDLPDQELVVQPERRPRPIPMMIARPDEPETDAPVRRAQATPSDLEASASPIPGGASASTPAALLAESAPSGRSLSLQQALTGAITSNPDLVTLRAGSGATASLEAVEVARHFPTTLNPTVFIDYRPITLIPNGTFGNNGTGATSGTGTTTTQGHNSFYHNGQGYLLVALRQPLEFGHQTTHRYGIARAAYSQLQWQIMQAELNALVQTYRFFQTAAYRREKARVADRLADFNENLRDTLDRRLRANQAQAADVALAKVEARATRQQARAAQQDYLTALTDLRNQIGVPDSAAETEPLGEFTLPGNIPPLDEQGMIEAALRCRPDLKAAQANIDGSAAAVRLAKGDRIPSAILGPQYVQDEAGIQYIGFNFVPTLPLANNGKPLVRQREADQRRAVVALQQAQQRVVAQVRSAVAKWNGATDLVNDSSGLTDELTRETDSLERLFEAGQTDLTKVTQARQRLIQLENAQLDAVWAATQAQADLMAALGIPSLIQNLLQAAESGAGVAPGTPTGPGAGTPIPPTPSPFDPAPR